MPNTARRRRNLRRGLGDGTLRSHLGPIDPIFEVSESVALLEQSLESQQRQIHEISETTSRQIGELATNTNRQIREVMTGMEKQGTEFRTEIRSLANEFSNSKKTNWPLFLSITGAIAVFLSAAYQISDLRTQVTMAPIVAKAEISEKDRSEIHQSITANKDAISAVQAQQKVVSMQLVEVETQFRLSDRSRNVQFAEQQRMNNIMMQIGQGKGGKDNPIDYPVGPFYFPETTTNAAPNAPGIPH